MMAALTKRAPEGGSDGHGDDSGEPPAGSRSILERTNVRAAIRWGALTVAIAFGFHRTLVDFYELSRNGDPGVYRVIAPVWLAICVVGISRRPMSEVRVFDRNLDASVVLLLGILGLAVRATLVPRLGLTETIWSISAVLLGLYIVLGIILLWGLRTVWRFRLANLVLLGLCPLPFLLVGAALGGSDGVYGSFSVLIGVFFFLIVAGKDRRWILGGTVAIAGVIVAVGFDKLGAPHLVTQVVPGMLVAVGLLVALIFEGGKDRPKAVRYEARTRMPLLGGVTAVLATGLVFGIFEAGQSSRLPPQPAQATVAGCAQPPLVPGFHLMSRVSESWAPAYFGPGATWERAEYVSQRGARTPTLAIDMIETWRPALLDDYPPDLTYVGGLTAIQGQPTTVGGLAAQRAYTDSNLAIKRSNESWEQITMAWRNNQVREDSVERVVVSVPRALPGVNLIPAPVKPIDSGVFSGSLGRLLATAPEYTIPPAAKVDALAHSVARYVLTVAREQRGSCR